MKYFLWCVLILQLLSVLCQAQRAISPVFELKKLREGDVLLNKPWKFHSGNNPAWANPAFDDRVWQFVNPSSDIHHLTQLREVEIGWFRLHLKVDSSLLNTPLALKIWQMGASEIYLNGKLIHKLGSVSKDKNKELLYNPRGNPLTFQFKGSTSQVLAIRYSFTKANPYLNFWGLVIPV